jgi:predicted dehydrogenase
MNLSPQGIHVLVTKPATQTLADHLEIAAEAEKHGVYVAVEMHKRFDPSYADGKQKVSDLVSTSSTGSQEGRFKLFSAQPALF